MAGKDPPATANPLPVSPTELIRSGLLPVEVNVNVLVEAEFNITSPKSITLALRLSCAWGDAVQCPVRGTVVWLAPAELVEISMLPLAVDGVEGAKLT